MSLPKSIYDSKSTEQLKRELLQLEQTIDLQQRAASSFQKAIEQSESQYVDAERQRITQQRHLQQLKSDLHSRSSRAEAARSEARIRKRELARRQELEKRSFEREERRRAILSLEAYEVDAMVSIIEQDERSRVAFEHVAHRIASSRDLETCQAVIWQSILGPGHGEETSNIATRILDRLRNHTDNLIIVGESSSKPPAPHRKERPWSSGGDTLARQQKEEPQSPNPIPSFSVTTPRTRSRFPSTSSHTRSQLSLSASPRPRDTATPVSITVRSPGRYNVRPPDTPERKHVTKGGDFFDNAYESWTDVSRGASEC